MLAPNMQAAEASLCLVLQQAAAALRVDIVWSQLSGAGPSPALPLFQSKRIFHEKPPWGVDRGYPGYPGGWP